MLLLKQLWTETLLMPDAYTSGCLKLGAPLSLPLRSYQVYHSIIWKDINFHTKNESYSQVLLKQETILLHKGQVQFLSPKSS